MGSIDNKIFYLKMHNPEMVIHSFHEKIMFCKDLTAIFTEQEIHKYLDN